MPDPREAVDVLDPTKIDLADELLTVAEAAAYLKVDVKAVRKWIHADIITGVRRLPNGRLRLPKGALKSVLRPA